MNILWSVYKKFSAYAGYISYIFIAIYLYEYNKNLDYLLLFGLWFAISAIFGFVIGNIITAKINPKIAILTANLLAVSQAVLFIYFLSSLNQQIIIAIAILAGVSNGIKQIADYIYTKTFEYKLDPILIQADETIVSELVKFILIASSVFFIAQTNNFELIFLLYIVSIFINSIIILILTPNYSLINNSLKEILRVPHNNPKLNILVNSTIIEGLFESIQMTILPIALLLLAGNILNWGLVNIAISIFSVVFGLLYFKKINITNYKLILGVTSFLLASTSILIIVDFNLITLIIFILLVAINEIISPVAHNASFENIVDLDPQKTSHLTEYKMYEGALLNLAKIIPILIMIYFKPDLSVSVITQFAIIIASLLPFITFTIIASSYKQSVEKSCIQ